MRPLPDSWDHDRMFLDLLLMMLLTRLAAEVRSDRVLSALLSDRS